MALHHLGLTIDYARLTRILRAGDEFTPFSHLRYLDQLGLSIVLDTEGDVSLFETCLALGLPVVVGVKTLTWPHWEEIVTEHAVLVVGIDQAHGLVYIHDPFFAEAPIEMELIRFETGWEEKQRWYAVVSLAPLEEQIS
jgi:hypothetical protein